MGAFKDTFDAGLVRQLAHELVGAWPDFPAEGFERDVAHDLDPLEMMARADHITDRLVAALPDRFADSSAVLWTALDSSTFTGWMVWPCGTFVARRGIDEPDTALPLLAGLTPRLTSEFPIRPFIERHPDVTYEHLRRWAADDDEHVRRLVSEGTRPRLPWAPVLRGLIADPTTNVPLLDALVDDPSPYVRRSVANHLNDISKDHPSLALELSGRWCDRGDGPAWVVRHGLRTLVKRGEPDALRLLGVHVDADVQLRVITLDRQQIAIGEDVTFEATLELRGDEPADLEIDYRVHYMGARGPKAPKVFKLTRRRLEPGVPTTVGRRHRFEHVSIRRLHPGPHAIDIQVNGRVLGSASFELTQQAPAPELPTASPQS